MGRGFTSTVDKEFSDSFFDFSQTERRLARSYHEIVRQH